MKLLLLISTTLLAWSAFASSQPELVNIMPTGIYAPKGFDSNDNAQIVIEGYYPNTCYKTGLSERSIDQVNKVITIDDQTYHFAQDMCLMMVVPFTKVIDLGIVAPGDYQVHFVNNGRVTPSTTQLNVVEATKRNTDDYLYLPVSEASFTRQGPNGVPAVILSGTFKNTCYKYDRSIVKRETNSNTIEILPLAQMDSTNCVNEDRNFKIPVDVNFPAAGRVLLHIRSLNGQAVNRIVDL